MEINNQQEHPPKINNKVWVKLSEAILSILGDFWEKFKCSPRPTSSKSDGTVPSQQGALTTCNLTYWEVSQQTYVQTLLPSLGVVIEQNKALRWGRGGGGRERGFWQIAPTTFKSPQTPLIVYFPATISFQGHINFPISPGQQTFAWGTDILSSRSIGHPRINEGVVLVISVFRTVLLPLGPFCLFMVIKRRSSVAY